MTAADPSALHFANYPLARAPDRQHTINSSGIKLAIHEWGDIDAPPLLLVHGAFDFARTFDVFAPLLADAGYRVVCYDQRGHGDSDHAALYSWVADERDMLAVADATSRAPNGRRRPQQGRLAAGPHHTGAAASLHPLRLHRRPAVSQSAPGQRHA